MRDTTPAAMSVAAFGVTLTGVEGFCRAGTTVTGFMTSLLGLFAGVCVAIYWKRKVRVTQRSRRAKTRRSEKRKQEGEA